MTTSCVDPALEVIDTFLSVMAEAFNPKGSCPPPDGGTTAIRFFAGDGALPNFQRGDDCNPFVWVRAAHRFRARIADFPAAFVGDQPCGAGDVRRVLAVEVGVARCTSMEADPDWETLRAEAVVSLDDSWRIELALCRAAALLRSPSRAVATDTVLPVGPEGGVIAWTGMAYVNF